MALRRTVVFVLWLLLAACSDPTSPSSRVLKVGRYQWSAQHERSAGFSPDSFGGIMTITRATADSLTLTFTAPRIRTQPVLTPAWNVDAYAIVIDPVDAGNITMRLSRDGESLRCSGVRSVVVDRLYSTPITCRVAFIGPW